jgi:hypothetical protein
MAGRPRSGGRAVTAAPADTRTPVREIVLPRPLYTCVINHVVRKLTGYYLDGETRERKAFGIVAGCRSDDTFEVTAVFPLVVNLRRDSRYAAEMDEIVDQYAIPSTTANEQRGWIAHPRELRDIEDACDRYAWSMFGSYHTHRVAWPSDPMRDTCTELDRVLATGSEQWMFIVSAVDLQRTVLRAFFEGDNDRETAIRVVPDPVNLDAKGL